MSRGPLSHPGRQTGSHRLGSFTRAERRPFQAIALLLLGRDGAAQGAGPGRAKQYFFCSLLHRWNSIRKEETQARPNTASEKKPRRRETSSHILRESVRSAAPVQFPPRTRRTRPEHSPPRREVARREGEAEFASAPDPVPAPLTLPQSRSAQQTRPTLPSPAPDPGWAQCHWAPREQSFSPWLSCLLGCPSGTRPLPGAARAAWGPDTASACKRLGPGACLPLLWPLSPGPFQAGPNLK